MQLIKDITCSIWGCVASPFSLSIYSVLFPIVLVKQYAQAMYVNVLTIAWVPTSNLISCSVYIMATPPFYNALCGINYSWYLLRSTGCK